MTLYRGFRTQAELDAEYDTRRWAADPDAAMARFAAESERARRDLECSLGVPYGPSGAETLDLFGARPGAPLLVFFHGGYWRARSAADFACVALGPVAAGLDVAVVDYALCPAVRMTEVVRQARAAVAWLAGQGHDRIVVAGHSAGGHLTAMVLCGDPPAAVRGGCAISGLFDLAPFPHTWLQEQLRLDADEVRELSPLHRLPARSAPLIVTYGGRESAELRRQSDDFAAAWAAAGLEVERLPQPDADHYSAIDGLLDPASPLCRALVRQAGMA